MKFNNILDLRGFFQLFTNAPFFLKMQQSDLQWEILSPEEIPFAYLF